MSSPLSQVRLQADQDGHRYELALTVDGERLHIEMRGNDADGQLLLDFGTAQTVPAVHLAVLAQLLASGAAALAGDRRTPVLQERRHTHSNSHRPWTPEDDQRLKDLAAAPGTTIRDLTQVFGRSRGAIRSRLERMGVTLGADTNEG
ncbi:hypothetical protein [Nonomuraea sp. C10]|uniref:hypothetical protein n=1 Tax=Nonomuraea sp. C10 TaxID=2600577 RepID=UPI0011CDE52B|nr:hypothetical protein [Nonomuraea sp. C10]TXK41462.1 hypothetical protein FR742_19495 [Nonomuraea sp. C10]